MPAGKKVAASPPVVVAPKASEEGVVSAAAANKEKQVKGVKLPRRSTYFVEDDIVWVKPPGRLPLWPAEVVRTEKEGSIVVCRLFCAPEGVDQMVTSPGRSHLYFFDKMFSDEEIEACVEDRLQRKRHSVEPYEKDFRKAVAISNGLMRTVLTPSKLQPFEVAGVGVVHSLMRTHISAPRQPMTGKFEPQPAVIVLRPGLANAARDLKGFDWVWILFHFSYATMLGDENSGKASSTPAPVKKPTSSDDYRLPPTKGEIMASKWKTTVIPPRDTKMRGVFATRSPHRPNGIGLSCVRLVDVQGLCVHIADHDLLHGTPVLDIKPYLPFCDSHPDARAGWVSELDEAGLGGDDHKAGVAIPVHRSFPDSRQKRSSSSGTN